MDNNVLATWSLAPVCLSAAVDLAVVDRHGLAAVSPATAHWLRYAAGRLVRYLDEDRAVDQLRPLDVAAWVQFDADRGLAATGINSNLRAIRTLYSRLQRAGVVSSNPAALVRYLPEPPLRPRAVSESDYLAMRAAATNSRDRALLDVLWASGCRLGGLLSMRVDRMERWERAGRPCFALLVIEKGARSRWVYVGRERLQSEGLVAWLDERPPCAGPWLWLSFASPFDRMALGSVSAAVRRCRLAAGIPDERPCSPHAFRHAFAIRMLDEGEDLAAVSAWLGHCTPEFTASVYVRRSERQLREKFFGAVVDAQ